MQNHYFIGISVPSSLGVQADKFRSEYNLQTHYKVIPHIEDLHVTLLFLGTVLNEQIDILMSTLQEIAVDHHTFQIHIDGLSYFGSPSRPRVVYLDVRDNPMLTSLQKAVADRIAVQLGKPLDNRRFTPHVTIAKKRRETKGPTIAKEAIESIEIPVPVFSLFVIHPKKSPKYEAIATFELRSITPR